MAGILNPKERFFDTFITQEGKRQIAQGLLRFSFVSFTDSATFYEPSSDDKNVAADPTNRIFFESSNRPQDSIIPEFNNSGFISFPAGDYELVGDRIVQTSGSSGVVLKGQNLVTAADAAITDSLNSFIEQQILGTQEIQAQTKGFEISENSHAFKITDMVPISPSGIKNISLRNIESLWQDMRLSHLPNYKYLPPINLASGVELANFPQLQQPVPLNFNELMQMLGANDPSGDTGVGMPYIAQFSRTTPSNNIVGQMFQITSGSMEKLRVIDFGEFPDEDPFSPGKRIFFAGKLFNDDNGEETFFNLFTIILD